MGELMDSFKSRVRRRIESASVANKSSSKEKYLERKAEATSAAMDDGVEAEEDDDDDDEDDDDDAEGEGNEEDHVDEAAEDMGVG